MMQKASKTSADEVFLDLEDAVAPLEKEPARPKIVAALRELDWAGKVRVVRVNGIDTKYFYRDLIEVVEGASNFIDSIMVPKVERDEDVYLVDKLLTQLERNMGTDHKIGIEAQIESAGGMARVEQIAFASDRLESLILGPGDYAASRGSAMLTIGVHDFPYPGHIWHYALNRMVDAAKAAGIQAIDGPYAKIQDLKGFEESSHMAKLIGCDGKWAVHPTQIEPCNRIFAPSKEELAKAQKLIDEFERATKVDRKGVVSVDGEMVDAATIRMAQNVVQKARLAKLI